MGAGAGAAAALPFDAFLTVRRPALDVLDPPSSVLAREGDAECRASSALLTRAGRFRVGVAPAVPSNGASAYMSPYIDQYSLCTGHSGPGNHRGAQIITHHATLCLPYALSANG